MASGSKRDRLSSIALVSAAWWSANTHSREDHAAGCGNTLQEISVITPPASVAPNHEFGKIESCRIFDHLAATVNYSTTSIDQTHADDEVSHAPIAQPARTGGIGRDGSSQRCSGINPQRIERQILSFLG